MSSTAGIWLPFPTVSLVNQHVLLRSRLGQVFW
jgi:hypothetical protein